MKAALFTTTKTTSGNKVTKLVFACAWCPPEDYVQLEKNEQYSHGICDFHKAQLTKRIQYKH